jgi:perosamine synthetase
MTTGEGGIVTTSDDDLAEQLRRIRTHGEERPYWVARQGHNYRMPEMAAAIGSVQLKRLPSFENRYFALKSGLFSRGSEPTSW